ncbi:MAG: PAS domain S-box protein, partial [Gammaproteobacteria bacterium]|nr:PAS domain S-box protein [Gammaproteobacteria bacterium]
ELSQMIFTDFTHPDDTNLNWQLQQDLIKGKRDNYRMEKRCIRKNGNVFWSSVNVSAIRDENNNIHSIIGVLEDITERKNIESKLEKSTAQFKAIFNAILDAAVFVDTNRNIVMTNPSVYTQFGYNIEELLGKSSEILYTNTEDYQLLGNSHFNIEASKNSQLYEMTYRRKDGSFFIGETQGTKVEDEQGNIIGFIGIFRDISERKKTEERLSLSQKIFEDTAKLILVTDIHTNIIDANNAFCESTGYSREELIGQSPKLLQSGRHDSKFYRELWNSLNESGYWKGEIWDQKKNGEIFPTWSTISAVKDNEGQIINYVAISSDISVIKQSEKRLEHLAHYDQLTKLPNRMLFNDRLNMAIARADRHNTKLAVMYIDLDGFKQVNDSLGHTAGDKLLIDVANRLQSCVRDEDSISRLGGDEFAVIVDQLESIESLRVLAKRISRKLAISLNYENREISVTGSIGIAIYPSNGTTEETLLRHADQAMYYAKQQGANTYQFFDPAMNEDILNRIHLGSDLRSAIKNDEFFMLFQPKYDIKQNKVVGVEALIRWLHPERGLISPDNFIPFAEGSDLIIDIG